MTSFFLLGRLLLFRLCVNNCMSHAIFKKVLKNIALSSFRPDIGASRSEECYVIAPQCYKFSLETKCSGRLLLLAGDTKPLSPLPQAFAADAQLLCQLRLIHRVLMLQHKSLKVVLE